MYTAQTPYNTSPLQSITEFFRQKTMLTQLILINIIVWLSITVFNVFLYLIVVNDNMIIPWLAMPSDLAIWLYKPWTIFTYMFLHENFLHLLFNMLMLYFSGRIFLEFLNEQQLLATYIIGGIAGAVLYVISYNLFPRFNDVVTYSILLGASASVIAILISTAIYAPDYTVNLLLLGPVRLKHLALVFIVIDIISIDKGNSGGHIAHLGGALWGVLFALNLKRGNDFSTFFTNIVQQFRRKKKSNMRAKEPYTARPTNDETYNRQRKEKQAQIDHILEKISKSGYDSLSKQEKELLFDASNKPK